MMLKEICSALTNLLYCIRPIDKLARLLLEAARILAFLLSFENSRRLCVILLTQFCLQELVKLVLTFVSFATFLRMRSVRAATAGKLSVFFARMFLFLEAFVLS